MPPKAVFEGQTFAISGSLAQPQREHEDIKKHGGHVASTVTKAVNVLVSTEADVVAGSLKVSTARGRGLAIVQEGYVVSCIGAKRLLEPCFPPRWREATMSAASGRSRICR